MRLKACRFYSALILSAALTLLSAVPAFAKHKVLDPDTYVLEKTEDGYELTDLEGEPLTGWIEDEDKQLFYFDDGEMNRGWDKIKGKWYYFDPETGALLRNTKVLNYDGDENGAMVKIHEW